MYNIKLERMNIAVDFPAGHISSLTLDGVERVAHTTPLFKIRVRDGAGRAYHVSSYDAIECLDVADGAVYRGFSGADLLNSLSVRVALTDGGGEAAWRISVDPGCDSVFVEWVDFPRVALPALVANNSRGNGGRMLYPYNEGEIVSDMTERFEYRDIEYPSMGIYCVFPNMVHSQMLAYLWEGVSLYVGIHDERRGLKGIDFIDEDGDVTLQLRLFTGCDLGGVFTTDYPIVWSALDGYWEAAAERYRSWFESALPSGVKKIKDNSALPEWYAENPLVITYPVRGKHDTDIMNPNLMFPYVNALPVTEEIRNITDSRLLVLLMHWEGTAPWAPPYVWPPYGGEEELLKFRDALHARGDMLGVYCSGFGYTSKSNVVDDYDTHKEYERRGLWRAMCTAPDGSLPHSLICTDQRVGYDICPASPLGRELLWEGYKPLFESGLDYAQILDQNHGGGQYLCYSRNHGHPAAPGAWMTENMQRMLGEWQAAAPGMLFGCESSAAEPFIGNLLLSDNRYELNYATGRPVPLYAYIYHEYLRNFMGNQVCCPLDEDTSTLLYRLAYSFSVGDLMTLVLDQHGQVMPYWGKVKLNRGIPDKDRVLRLVKNLTAFYKREGREYLLSGRMTRGADVEMGSVTYGWNGTEFRKSTLPALLTSAWEREDGTRLQLIVNPTDVEVTCCVNGKAHTVPPLDAISVKV